MIAVPPHADRPATDGIEFVFREVRSAHELRDVLALRYRVYTETLGLWHLHSIDHASGLDADVYDLYSRHFALFARCGRRESVVGTLRISSERTSPLLAQLYAIAAAHPTLAAHFDAPRTAPLPMLSYLEQAPTVRELYDRLVARGARVAEPGRLTVHPEFRVAAARRGLKLSRYIVEGALAFGWGVEGLDHVFMDCDVAIEPLYRRFGFEPVPGAGAAYQPALDITFTVLQATPSLLPETLRPRVEALARQLREDGEAVMGSDAAADTRPASLARGPACDPRPARAGCSVPAPVLPPCTATAA